MIQESSIGVIQNAANAFQLNLLAGFDEVCGGIEVLNLPFIGSYPKRFTRAAMPACTDRVFKNTRVSGIGFSNWPVWKQVSRFLSLRAALRRKEWREGDCCVIYSMHLPFVAAVSMAKRRNPGMKICLIVPDMPEFMSENPGFLYRSYKAIEGGLLDYFRRRVDCYVLLTAAMASKLGARPEQYVVVEGIASVAHGAAQARAAGEPLSVCYTGTLAGRYGIRDLVDAFRAIERSDIRLWICGDGDARDYVLKAAASDNRITYFGQMGHAEVLALQQSSTVLINPRGAEGEYTKYSFPSKVLEYMSSGRPTIIHRLEGIPEEYYEYCFCTGQPGAAGLKSSLEQVIAADPAVLDSVGLKAQEFVRNKKSSALQVRKIVELVSGGLSA